MSLVISEYRGDWNSIERYYAGDIIRHAGAIWLALKASQAAPPPEPETWKLIIPTGGPGHLSVIKPSDTTRVNDDNVTPDPHLTLQLQPDRNYAITLTIILDSPNASQILTLRILENHIQTSTYWHQPSFDQTVQPFQTNWPLWLNPGKRAFTIYGTLTTSTGTPTLAFAWAQGTANPNPITVFSGSSIIALPLTLPS